ncbi:hypothetical protein [Terrisporobacter muris]|uniref:DUF3784 domain-containing protein n=1 Tax=Terrisporobacter muris TaxID=2963284 RepID=A0A9X2MCN7_9FIRM|nr:hypothetical protein [Terrisporobacter muris]MCR1824343.1 hypothetical protein [Terrisporobacter muris]
MVDFVLGIFLIVIGAFFIYSGLKLQRTRDIRLIKNNMVNTDKIKDKDSYINFNFKINITAGFIVIIQGLVCILSMYFSIIESISWIINIIAVLTIFVYVYKLVFKAPKF